MEQYTKKQVQNMSLDELLDVAEEQEKVFTKNRGYFSGMTRERLAILGEECLRENILKVQRDFIRYGWI